MSSTIPSTSPAATAPRASRWRLIAHTLMVLVGLGAAIWGTVRLTHIRITCRGVELHPGDVCRTSSFSQLNGDKVFTYEYLRHQVELSQPFVIGAGLLVMVFGLILLLQEMRRAKKG